MDVYGRLIKELEGEVRRNEPMSAHTSLGVGGPADLFVSPNDRDELVRAVQVLAEEGVPFLVVGNGTNLLVREGGIRGAVLRLTRALNGFEIEGTIMTAGGGLALSRSIDAAVDRSLGGLEFAAGIPGTVGGAIKMNAGGYGGEIGRRLRSVDLIDSSASHFTRRCDELGFSYRTSAIPREWIILEADFELEEGNREESRRIIAENLAHRHQTQPVGRSAGCIFRNPSGSSAGELIERAGLKGASIGGARVSRVHANFIITSRGASAHEVLDLIAQVRAEVAARSGVELELEVEIAGAE